ncbi:pseudouridine synthase [Ningiella sp. W23]|uniref:pseudouridine synthase n=1 Tax=Ningiella sp. W23 TaxID=3023715 RepID=UPI0037579C87
MQNSSSKTTKTKRKIVLFNKPFKVLSQFSDESNSNKRTLKSFIDVPQVYAAGRLDYDSEGLLVLTNDGKLIHQLAHPANTVSKTYWVQVEGEPNDKAIKALCEGLNLKDGKTSPAVAKRMEAPMVWPRTPPIRVRKSIPDSWLSLTISEGRNRQVRRMTAHIGHPTLRLIRYRVASWTIDGIDNGEYVTL